MKKNGRFVSAIIVLILLCVSGFMLWAICRTWSSRSQLKSRCSYKTTAIVDSHIHYHIHNRKSYRANLVYEYNGASYHSFSESHSYDTVYPLGEQVNIYIDPESPDVIYCPKDTFSLVLLSGIIGFFALIPMVLAFLVIKAIFLKKEKMKMEE